MPTRRRRPEQNTSRGGDRPLRSGAMLSFISDTTWLSGTLAVVLVGVACVFIEHAVLFGPVAPYAKDAFPPAAATSPAPTFSPQSSHQSRRPTHRTSPRPRRTSRTLQARATP